MPRWILALVAVATMLGVVGLLIALQGLGSGGKVEVYETVEGGDAKLTVPTNQANQAQISEADGAKILTPRAGLEGFSMPEFSLVNQDGEPVTEDIFEGKVTILNFIFTNCLTACPPMNANLLRVYHELEGTPVQIVSISVDPVHDTPKRLTEYAATLGVDTDRWVFLTGPEGEASRVCFEALKFDISEDPDESQTISLANGSSMSNILHPIKFFLVGPDRRILDFCSHQVASDRERFTELAKRAAE